MLKRRGFRLDTLALCLLAVLAVLAASIQPTLAQGPGYLDDRSTPQALVTSYYNAINRHEYVRAYSYWQTPAGAPSGPPPFPRFQQGYANTAVVRLAIGTVGGDAGAGQLYYTVPVVVVARTTGGATQTFAGCYTLHLANPAVQAVPPFQPLGIQSATIRQASNNASAASLLARACQGPGARQTSPIPPSSTASPTTIAASRYLDNRSTPQALLRSYYNAINRHEYARAYSYWQTPAGAPSGPPPFARFQEGYANTTSVQLDLGNVTTGAAAGNLYYTVPVVLIARTTGGATQTFAGCYTLHLAQPGVQGVLPFKPLGTQSARIRQASNNASAASLLAGAC